MLTYEIIKTNTLLPQNGLTPILIGLPLTYVCLRLVLWNKAKPMLLTYREETKQPSRPIAGLPTPWVLSCAGKLLRYLHRSYFLPYRNNMSTPDMSYYRNKYYRTQYNQWCCLHWMPRHAKSLTVNCCRVLFMTYWHKFPMIFNGSFVASGVDTV